jgi:hypothetical protein
LFTGAQVDINGAQVYVNGAQVDVNYTPIVSTTNTLIVMYSNVDSLLNKRLELSTRIQEEHPDIIALTEIYPKNFDHSALDMCELSIEGYDERIGLPGKESNRGVILYIKSTIGSLRVDSLTQHPYSESVWANMSFNGDKPGEIESGDKPGDTLLIGCVYRSPERSSIENNHKLLDLINKASELNYKYVLVMGDFNMRGIDWSSWTSMEPEAHFSHIFLEGLQDNFLHQFVREPTRYRVNQTPSLLDLVISNDENLVNNIGYKAPLGKSDHVVLTFDIDNNEHIQNSSTTRYVYHKGDYDGIRNVLGKEDWNSKLSHTSIDIMWDCLVKTIDRAKSTHIPTSRVSTGKKRKPMWMNKASLHSTKKKQRAWITYSHTRKQTDFLKYAKARNIATDECRKSKREFESKLSQEVKENRKHSGSI